MLLFVAGLVIRLFLHTRNALTLDEATSVLIASHSPVGILQSLSRDGNAPVYYFLLHGWMGIFGDGEDAVRSLSLLFGALLAPSLYLVARRFVSPTAAVTAGLLAVIWPGHVEYSQYARMYSLLPVLSLLFLYRLLDALESGDGPWLKWASVGACALALIWTHNYGMFVVAAAPIVWWLWRPRRGDAGRRLAITLAAVAIVDTLWLPVVLGQARSGVGDFIAGIFTPFAPLHSLLLFGAGYDYHYHQPLHFDLGSTTPYAVAWFLVAAIGATVLAFRNSALRTRASVWLALVLIPMGIPWVISLIVHPIYLPGRYEIVAYPAFALLLGTGAEAVRETTFGNGKRGIAVVTGVLAAYMVLAVATLVHVNEAPTLRGTAEMAATIADHAASGDLVITTGLTRAPIEYYFRRLPGADRLSLHSVPASTDSHPGWYDWRAISTDSAEVDTEIVTLIDGARRAGHSVIVVGETGVGEVGRDNRMLRAVLSTRSTKSDMLMDYFANDGDKVPTDQIILYHMNQMNPQ